MAKLETKKPENVPANKRVYLCPLVCLYLPVTMFDRSFLVDCSFINVRLYNAVFAIADSSLTNSTAGIRAYCNRQQRRG